MQTQNAKNGDGASTASYRIIKMFPHFQLWHFNAFDLSTRLNKSINEHEKVCIFWTKPNLVLLSVIATLDLKYALKRMKLDEHKLHIVYYEKTCSKKCIDRSDSLSMDVFIAYGEKMEWSVWCASLSNIKLNIPVVCNAHKVLAILKTP